MILRDFLFLNSTIVNQFLAQLEGGVYDETTQRSSESGKGGVGGGIKTPIGEARADKAKESSFEDERHVRQTPESRFNRLYERCWTEPSHRYGDGESHQQLIDRAGRVLVELLSRTVHGCCVVASHGTRIARGLEHLGLSDPHEHWLQMPTPAIYRIGRLDHGITLEGPDLVNTLPPLADR